jgi:hypothetical protein
MYHNSSLPKLLAKENLTIRHGNYQTPWFDIKNRVLGLPLWKDMGKDVYDLFVGHEVGHALETPYEGWHDSPEKLQGCPRSYINVIEDARIERKVKTRYPGLVGPFSRAYANLFEDNFFGTEDIDVSELRIIDKINLQAKVGSHVDIEFTDEEQVFMDRAMRTEDFQEVLELVKDIVAYDKTQEEDKEEEETPDENKFDETDETESEEESDPSQQGGDDQSDDQQEQNTPNSSGDEEDEEDNGQSDEGSVSLGDGADGHNGVSVTDEAFRKAEKSLLDTDEDGQQTLVVSDIHKEIRKKIVVDFKDLQAERAISTEHAGEYILEDIAKATLEYPTYIKTTKRSVAVAVKEFEMRKAATQWAKATTAKTGVIDVNKLFSYKTNEDIFKQTTRLHDAKSHGMIMLIDYSGSMYESLPNVLDQLIHLVLFCKQVNIPFDVYAFTTQNSNIDYYDLKTQGLLFDGDMDLDGISMPLLTSSSLKKSDFEASLKALHIRATASSYVSRQIIGKSEDFGSTPLNQALIMSHHLIKEFKVKHAIEKMNLVVFSDGDANRMQAYQDQSLEDNKVTSHGLWKGVNMMIDGKLVKSESREGATAAILENINKRLATNCIGFFMADNNRDFNFKVDDICGNAWAEDERKEAQKEYRKNKCVVRTNALGYNEFYLIKGGNNLETADDDFEVTSDHTRGQMATAFKKYSKSKKQNKVLMTTFGRCVA